LLLLTSATERPTGRLGCAGEALAFFLEKNERAQRPFSPLSRPIRRALDTGRHQISCTVYKAERHRGKLAVARADCFAGRCADHVPFFGCFDLPVLADSPPPCCRPEWSLGPDGLLDGFVDAGATLTRR
jgi:hypothetical protein